MDIVLVGLPGSGKSVVGKRVAHRHGAAFVDLDEEIEREAGKSIPDIFAAEGEAGFRARERRAVEALGPADTAGGVGRVISTGGGAVVDPRNRWHLYRNRLPIWLDGRPEVLAQRLRRSVHVRPLVSAGDPIGAIRSLARSRERFYAAGHRVNGIGEVSRVVETIERLVETIVARAGGSGGTVLVRAETRLGRFVLGEGIVANEVADALRALEARRAIVVSEPGAWQHLGSALAIHLGRTGWPVEHVLLPQGEEAKRLAVIEEAARELARRRVERDEPIIAVGGGALGDAAGFLAATYLRGIPFIQVPTTLVAQIDSSIGGKTGVDLPEGKNLVGAFHQPASVVIDIAALRTLPERERRAALGEAVKMGALGDERLLELLEAHGDAIARGEPEAFEGGTVAELVERAAWAKVEVVVADEREAAGRIALNLGHSVGHAIESAARYENLLHGEAVAFGLRAACRIGVAIDITPPDRAERLERLLDRLSLGLGPLPYSRASVLAALGSDKKHSGGRLRWVLPTATSFETCADVPADLVESVVVGILSGSPSAATAGGGR